MAKVFPWKRFWCRREDEYSLGDQGFLSDPDGEYGNLLNPKLTTFQKLQTIPCLVLLGEPGIGKSWSVSVDMESFVQQSAASVVMRLDLRSYGSEDRLYKALFEDDAFLRWVNGTHDLYLSIDSLDECLLRVDTVATLLSDEIPKRPVERLKLRIACRTAAWPSVLENALKGAFGEAQFSAVELVPLRRTDALTAAATIGISDAEAFMKRVDELQIAPLANKPVTLNMLLGAFLREGDLPGNVLDLYEKGCFILCEEQNESRRGARRVGSLSTNDRIAVASRIGAATQLSNRYAIWTGMQGPGVPNEDVSISELVGGVEAGDHSLNVTTDAILETLGTGLFSSRGQERLGWSHQTFAEYLASRYCLMHHLSIQQLRSLLFHPRRRRIIPQLREVASWLAVQQPDLFAEIAEYDPEVLLGSAAPSLSPSQRALATDKLLTSCDKGEFLHVKYNLSLSHLAHENLGEQLRAILIDRGRPTATRHLAVNIAKECVVKDIGDELVEIALSQNEAADLRSIAALALAAVGTGEQRTLLVPLLSSDFKADPKDQLRGAALQAVYPDVKYDDAIWNYLEPPRDPLFFGSYHYFLTYSMPLKLNASNLLLGLRWCARQPAYELGPIHDLEGELFWLAVEYVDEPNVAELLATAVLKRCESFQSMPKRRGKKPDLMDRLAGDAVRRHRFLEAFIPLLSPNQAYLTLDRLSLPLLKDLPWLIDRVIAATSPCIEIEANLISRLACSWEPDAANAVWDACQISPILARVCNPIFEPVPLDSDIAKWERASVTELFDAKNGELAPPLQPRCEAKLELIESGDVDKWLALTAEMSVDEGGTRYLGFAQMEVTELPGWLKASAEIRSRIVAAAKAYLTRTTFPAETNVFPSTTAMYGAHAGVNALALLCVVEPDYLQKQARDFWTRWIPSLIGDGRAGQEKQTTIKAVYQVAASAAAAEMNARLLEQIEFESSAQHPTLFCSVLIDQSWSELLGTGLLDKLRKNELTPTIEGELLHKLLVHKSLTAKDWAEQTVSTEYQSDRGFALSRALLTASEDAGWNTIWPIIENDKTFGRRLLEAVSFAELSKESFTNRLTDTQLGDLFIWLLEQYPPDNRRVSGFMGPVDSIRFLRDGALERLKRRASFDACDAIARAELRLPQHRWLRLHFDEAEMMACAVTWEAPSTRDVVVMASDATKRLVESGEQLLNVVVESLVRLQSELHGELASVGDLWNSRGSDWWPKQEEDVSDYVARFLKRDLSSRAIVINREVQIRRGRQGEMAGQNTDIHVDATSMKGRGIGIYGTISLIIEVKGSWNRGLMTDMEVQLWDRYMINSDCLNGLYVVAHFSAANWIRSDNRRAESEKWRIEELKQSLASQASEISGGLFVRSFVLDARLDSTKALVTEVS